MSAEAAREWLARVPRAPRDLVLLTGPEPAYRWRTFCQTLDALDLVDHQLDPARQEELVRRLQDIFLTRTRDEWVEELAGLETCERLDHVASFGLELLSTHDDPRLAQLVQGLRSALSPFDPTYQDLQQGAAWLRDIASILEPSEARPRSAKQVATQLRGYLDTVHHRPDLPPTVATFGAHLDKVSRSYWPGLFHCYEVPGLPRTNNELDSRFRDTSRRLLRTTGQKGLTQRTLHRQGAWELLRPPSTEAELLDALPQTPSEDLAQERQRFAEHRQRFAMKSRSRRQTQAQFAQLRQKWSALPPTGTG
jgi:hypothetical protein